MAQNERMLGSEDEWRQWISAKNAAKAAGRLRAIDAPPHTRQSKCETADGVYAQGDRAERPVQRYIPAECYIGV